MTDLCQISDVQALTQKAYDLETKPTSGEVNDWIADASARIAERTGRAYTETTVTDEYHDGTGSEFILLDHYPITTMTSLTVDNDALTLNTDYWVKDADAGVIECKIAPAKRASGLATGHRNVKASYKYGLTAIPSSVKDLCAVMVALKAIDAGAQYGSTNGPLKSYSDGDVSISYAESDKLAGGLIERHRALLLEVPQKVSVSIGGLE